MELGKLHFSGLFYIKKNGQAYKSASARMRLEAAISSPLPFICVTNSAFRSSGIAPALSRQEVKVKALNKMKERIQWLAEENTELKKSVLLQEKLSLIMP